MLRLSRPLRNFVSVVALAAASTALLFVTSEPAWTDDRDLLRFNSAKPYLMLMLDTSASMSLKMGAGNEWAPGFADGPDSRLYQAKQAVYDVFKDVDDVHFGFASYNQDKVRVVAKHWLYFVHPDNAVKNWPLSFPEPDIGPRADGALTFVEDTLEDTDGDGVPDTGDGVPDTRVGDIGGDVVTLGPHFQTGTPGVAGDCSNPLDLDDTLGRNRAQAFAIEGNPKSPTILWLEEDDVTYRLEVSRSDVLTPLGATTIDLIFDLEQVDDCSAGGGTDVEPPSWTTTITFWLDAFLNEFLVVDSLLGGGPKDEAYAGLWEWTDVISEADFGTERPFTGKGWEGNYDSGPVSSESPFDNLPNNDPYCRTPSQCFEVKPVEPTTIAFAPDGERAPPLDRGDMIPFDWSNTNRDAFLRRLNPGASIEDFRVASYFEDAPTGGIHLLASSGVRPLAAADESPLAKSLNDARCWYLGKEGKGAKGKCAKSAFFDKGWEGFACEFDSEYGCRKPFFIAISDGEDNGGGEDATADIAALFSQSGVRTWAINLGDPASCNKGGGLHPIVQAGSGECVTVQTRAELLAALKSILGEIRETARAFASAAVPSVQATVEQKIFVTRFTPLNEASVWDGHVNAFLKPLPIDENTGVPIIDAFCDGTGSVPQRETECLLWDAGEVLLTTPTNAANQTAGELGDTANRRVFYGRESLAGDWPNKRDVLTPIDCSDDPPSARCLDMLYGMEILARPGPGDPAPSPADLAAAEVRANAVIQKTLAVKNDTIDIVDPVTGATTSRPIKFLLGDIFHSTPLAIGTPPSTFYFAQDLFTDLGDPAADCASGNNTGYRCFFRKHQNRRKMLTVGSNDGMLHFFDAGNFRTSGTDPFTGKTLANEFDNGLGKEIFAYIPRTVLPGVRELAEGNEHQFTVDGAPAAGDVFIDPVYAGSPNESEREWRTVVVGGLREGGSGYYALDITQPDWLGFTDGVFVPDDKGSYVPSCTSDYDASECGPVPFPSPLWEFTDAILDPVSGQYVRLDEDASATPGAGKPDLGDTWSTANIGRLQVCKVGGSACKPDDPDPANREDLVDLFVAVFGGGMDPESKLSPENATRGHWVYMVDIETGDVIYKRQVLGAVPSEIAAVDADQDGILDRLYFGTLAGRMYRVDLVPDASGDLPALADPGTKTGVDGLTYDVPPRILPGDWDPRIVFDTLGRASESDSGLVRRPIYQRPSVFFIARLGLYGLAFGTGDREDLWSLSGVDGRFYVFVDDTNEASAPLTEAPFERILLASGDVGTDFLLDPARAAGTRGWYLVLPPNERVITDAFLLSGITIFSSFKPRVVDQDGEEITPGCESRPGGGGGGPGGPGSDEGPLCSKLGNSNIFAVNTTNANGLLQDLAGARVRSTQVSTFVTNPFAEPGATKNPGSSGDGGGEGEGEGDGGGATADDLDQRLIDIMNSLKGLFPSNCKFANYRIDVKTIAADTSLQFIAPIPVCIVDKNWKEF